MRRDPRTWPVVLVLLLAGCGSPGGEAGAERTSTGTTEAPSGAVTVFAAASLTDAVGTLSRTFQSAHPGVRIQLSFGGSSGLAQSIVNGAPADVFAAASTATMATVTGHGAAAGAPAVLARNELQIATARGNPRGIRTLADAVRPDFKLAICAPQVPCGAAALSALAAAGLRATPVTLESEVKAVLTKVRLGEVDVGLVYRTDVLAAATQVTGVALPRSAGAVTTYQVVALKQSRNPKLAAAVVRYLQTKEAAATFARFGFLPP